MLVRGFTLVLVVSAACYAGPIGSVDLPEDAVSGKNEAAPVAAVMISQAIVEEQQVKIKPVIEGLRKTRSSGGKFDEYEALQKASERCKALKANSDPDKWEGNCDMVETDALVSHLTKEAESDDDVKEQPNDDEDWQ